LIPEVPREGARISVCPALRHGVNLDTRGPSLRGVESAADQLELGDGVAAEVRTAHPHNAPVRGYLLAVQVDLKSARLIAVRGIRAVRTAVAGGFFFYDLSAWSSNIWTLSTR
jgi:hypothetical protein